MATATPMSPASYRGFDEDRLVYPHVELPDRNSDTAVDSTAAEARSLADAPASTAALIEGR
jgi:hypothetical protein